MMHLMGHQSMPLSLAAGGAFFGAVWLGVRSLFASRVRAHYDVLTKLSDELTQAVSR
jgi:hypothetical protein